MTESLSAVQISNNQTVQLFFVNKVWAEYLQILIKGMWLAS